jgi:hypothetical protein
VRQIQQRVDLAGQEGRDEHGPRVGAARRESPYRARLAPTSTQTAGSRTTGRRFYLVTIAAIATCLGALAILTSGDRIVSRKTGEDMEVGTFGPVPMLLSARDTSSGSGQAEQSRGRWNSYVDAQLTRFRGESRRSCMQL